MMSAEAVLRYPGMGLIERRLRQLCADGQVEGAQRLGRSWMIPVGFRWKRQKPGPKPKK
jgi:hypothetical protein